MKKAALLLAVLSPLTLLAQQEESEKDLGNKEYIIVKDYKPVLAESAKISDLPDGDTATAAVPVLRYDFTSRKAETMFETSAIKAVKVKDEPLQKLYRSYVKLGAGNYSKYNGELYVNSLRSKKGALGLNLRHLSASPGFDDVGNAAYSNNRAAVDGKYFFDHATFSGEAGYKRDVVHYYGYDSNDTIIDKEDTKQRFSDFGIRLGFSSNYNDSDHFNYAGRVSFSSLTDNFDVTENEIIVDGGVGKMFGEMYGGLDLSLEFFKKTDAEFQDLSLSSNLDRNILRFRPYIAFNRDRINFKAGVGIESQVNEDTDVHFFPRLDVRVHVSEGVLSVFANVNGQLNKNNYHTVTAENPFVNPGVLPKNTVQAIEFKGGLNGNFSQAVSFVAYAAYSKFRDFQYFVQDSLFINTFEVLYDDVTRLNLHAEVMYRTSEKLAVSLGVDQFSYNTDIQEKPWMLPNTVVTLKADYNLKDKILVKAALFGVGQRYARIYGDNGGLLTEKMDAYLDANLGVEYKYSKILSAFVNFNNVGFAKYQQYYGFPVERLNVLGGITYSF